MSERVFTVPWFPELERVPPHADGPGRELNKQSIQLAMMVAILVRNSGPIQPMLFGVAVGTAFEALPDQIHGSVCRASILTARRLGLIEERDGMIVPSEALLRTRPWWAD